MAGSDEDFLSRWSRRKRADRAGNPQEEVPPAAAVPAAMPTAAAESPPGDGRAPPPLPPVEALTPESDFAPFMQGEVDPGVRREALKKLFSDPRFNVMDGLDTYIDDYSKPDPIPQDWLGKLTQMAGLGDVPGREKAERQARELAAREAGAAGDAVPAVEAGVAAGPAPRPEAGNGPGADEGQEGAAGKAAACETPSIPARKLGD